MEKTEELESDLDKDKEEEKKEEEEPNIIVKILAVPLVIIVFLFLSLSPFMYIFNLYMYHFHQIWEYFSYCFLKMFFCFPPSLCGGTPITFILGSLKLFYPLQYSCLENPMDRGAWWATVHGVAKSWTRLSDLTLSVIF